MPANSPASVTRYQPVGRCIYCGTGDDLTDEHVIAFGLKGHLLLPKASCRKCARITGWVEQQCLRHMLGPFRRRLNFPTRKPKERVTHLPLHVVQHDDTVITKTVPVV